MDQVEEILDHMYDMMPSFPSLILLARKMNEDNGKPDTETNTIDAIMSAFSLVHQMSIDELQKKQLENIITVVDNEITVDNEEEGNETPREVPGYITRAVTDATNELQILNTANIKLRNELALLESLKEKVQQERLALFQELSASDLESGVSAIEVLHQLVFENNQSVEVQQEKIHPEPSQAERSVQVLQTGGWFDGEEEEGNLLSMFTSSSRQEDGTLHHDFPTDNVADRVLEINIHENKQ